MHSSIPYKQAMPSKMLCHRMTEMCVCVQKLNMFCTYTQLDYIYAATTSLHWNSLVFSSIIGCIKEKTEIANLQN